MKNRSFNIISVSFIYSIFFHVYIENMNFASFFGFLDHYGVNSSYKLQTFRNFRCFRISEYLEQPRSFHGIEIILTNHRNDIIAHGSMSMLSIARIGFTESIVSHCDRRGRCNFVFPLFCGSFSFPSLFPRKGSINNTNLFDD